MVPLFHQSDHEPIWILCSCHGSMLLSSSSLFLLFVVAVAVAAVVVVVVVVVVIVDVNAVMVNAVIADFVLWCNNSLRYVILQRQARCSHCLLSHGATRAKREGIANWCRVRTATRP